MKFETHELFPTPLWAVDFAPEDVVSMNARLKAEIEGIISPRISLLDGRNYQTSHDLHKRPAFAELIALVEGALGKIMQSLKVDEYPIMITGCWANINPYGSSHLTHNHPNNYLSGVYYVDVPDIGSQIVFQDTRPGIIMPHSESGRYTANSAIAPVRAGLMIFLRRGYITAYP